jgi:hypothetical protein
MDFETWSQAVPQLDGHWPFRQVCFQYSVKVQHEPDAVPVEHGYLANDITTPSADFINNLLLFNHKNIFGVGLLEKFCF